jgi:type III pantothenate kinase
MKAAKTVLACDIGNSRIALGCVVDEKASAVQRLGGDGFAGLADALREIREQSPTPGPIVASSVAPDGLAALESAAAALGEEVLLIGRDLPLPMEADVPEPHRIGTDRLCSAAMAFHRLEQACVVADLGTAITVDCVNDDGVFLGGAILPGLRTGAAALARETAFLPAVELTRPDWVFGKDTRQAIVGGLVYGARGALRELTEAYATELGKWPPLILTGGDAQLVGGDYDIVHAVVPDLSLLGIALAYRLARSELP